MYICVQWTSLRAWGASCRRASVHKIDTYRHISISISISISTYISIHECIHTHIYVSG